MLADDKHIDKKSAILFASGDERTERQAGNEIPSAFLGSQPVDSASIPALDGCGCHSHI